MLHKTHRKILYKMSEYITINIGLSLGAIIYKIKLNLKLYLKRIILLDLENILISYFTLCLCV